MDEYTELMMSSQEQDDLVMSSLRGYMDDEQSSNYEILPDVIEATAKDLLAKGWDQWSVAKDLLDRFLEAMEAAGAKVVLLDHCVRWEHESLLEQDLREEKAGETNLPYLRARNNYEASPSTVSYNILVDRLHENILDNWNDGLLRDVCADVILNEVS